MGPTKRGCMSFEAFSDVYFWQSCNDYGWYRDDEFYPDCTYALKRVFNKGTDDLFTVAMSRSGCDGIWKWSAWKGEDETWFDHYERSGHEDELSWDAAGFLFESMSECYDALVSNGWIKEV